MNLTDYDALREQAAARREEEILVALAPLVTAGVISQQVVDVVVDYELNRYWSNPAAFL